MNETRIKLIQLPVLLPRWVGAQVLLPGRIFVRRDVKITRTLLAHELVHVEQLRRMGLLRYWWTYIVLWIRFGYREHPMEFDAVVRSAEPRFLEWADSLLRQRRQPTSGTGRAASNRPADLR